MIKIKSYQGLITSLLPNQVFVFGSNIQGFHGAGAAGFASFGKHGNVWRDEAYATKSNGWKGLWNVKGVGEGFQEGTKGKSYAVPTVLRPNARRSRTKDEIVHSILFMYQFAYKNPQWEFLVSDSSMNGYSDYEMGQMYIDAGPIPSNVVFSEKYAGMIRTGIKGYE